jgi:hypothetical protein
VDRPNNGSLAEGDAAGADNDTEARSALWTAVCVAAQDVRSRFRVGPIHGLNGGPVRVGTPVPNVATWQLVEALSLLGVILRSEDATAPTLGVFGKSGPVKIAEESSARYLWAQHSLRGERSALTGRPDLVVTSTSEQPHSGNAIRIIEAKCVRCLGTDTVRSEFGKAYDLRVGTYLIWSFYTPTPRVVDGARGLGIDLEALGFDTPRRADLLKSPEALISHVAHTQEQTRQRQRFAGALEGAVEETKRKLLGPANPS